MGKVVATLRTVLSALAALLLAAAAPAESPYALAPVSAAEGEQQPAAPAPSQTAPRPADNKEAHRVTLPLDKIDVPPGTVLMLFEEAAEALRVFPNAVLISLAKYKEMLDQIEQLKRLAKPDRPEPPSSCKLSGQAEGDQVRLRAVFDFRTERPKTAVFIGCQRAWPAAAITEDGQIPLLQPSEDGWTVLVDKPGAHQLTADFVMPVARRGAQGTDRGFDIGLPRAAITILEKFEVPGPIADLRVAGRAVRPRRISDHQAGAIEAMPLGPIDRLEVLWKDASAQSRKGTPLLSSRARIAVRIDDAYVTSDVELSLEVVRGEVSTWRIHVPLPTDGVLERIRHTDERIQTISYPDRQNPVLTVQLKEATSDPLRILLQIRQPRLTTPLAVGPYLALDALPQGGTIEVRAPAHLRLRCRLHGEVGQRELTEEQRRDSLVALLSYWNLGANAGNPSAVPAPVSLGIEAVKGVVEVRATHTVRLLDVTPEGHSRWGIGTRIEANPVRTGLDRIDVQLPVDFQLDRDVGATPAELVEDIVIDEASRIARIRLAERHSRPFTVAFSGTVRVAGDLGRSVPNVREVSMDLPRPLSWSLERSAEVDRGNSFLDRGGQVTVAVTGGWEILPRNWPLLPPAGSQEYTWSSERIPVRAEWAWRSHRPDLLANSTIDVTLGERQARCRHQVRLHSGGSLPSHVHLRLPSGLIGQLQLVEGGQVETVTDRAAGMLVVRLADPEVKEPVLVLAYAIGHDDRRLECPFVIVEQATRGEMKVRVWSDPRIQPILTSRAWEELPLEVVAAQPNSLPALVLRGGMTASLGLRLTEPAGDPPPSAIVERAVVRATLAPDGSTFCWVRFSLSRLTSRHLDVSLPIAGTRANFQLWVDGRQSPFQIMDESGRESETGRLVRLRVEPELHRKPVVLDIAYQNEPVLGVGKASQAMLRPPILPRALSVGRTRWLIELPADSLPLAVDLGFAWEQQWRIVGWLAAPGPAINSSDMEQWSAGPDAAAGSDVFKPSLVGWQTGLGPVQIVHFPRQLWLIVCSLATLIAGFVLFLLRPSRLVFWCAAVTGTLAVALVSLVRPDMLPSLIYGCEPGLFVLSLVLAGHWMFQQRYRRQMVFMPAFTRLKGGTSIVHNGSNRAREPSTVDEPPRPGSSLISKPQASL